MTSYVSKVILLAVAILLLPETMAGVVAPSPAASHNLFAADLFSVLVNEKPNENIVYSPASIQTCLALAYLGAEGTTAEEMRKSLKLSLENKTEIAKQYGNYLRTSFSGAAKENGAILKMANRLYVNEKLQVSANFNKLALENFDSPAVNVNFADAKKSTAAINEWVEQQTQNKIRNLLTEDSANGDTSAILVNAIYFKAKWQLPFSATSTSADKFFNNGKDEVSVQMMYQDDRFKYGELDDLNAKVLEMPYANSELSMLIILPNDMQGLEKLEAKLKNIDLNDITSKLSKTSVDVFVPKFKIEFDVDLKKPLAKLGLTSMFSDSANFKSLFDTAVAQKISEVKHKAFLDVNEAGSEAAAATYMKIVPMSLNLDQKAFRADHPFVFAIRDKTSVYFAGHVTKF